MNDPKWKTTLLGIVGALLTVLTIWKPDFFTAETNAIIVTGLTAIITAVLSFIAIFSAKDEVDPNNIK